MEIEMDGNDFEGLFSQASEWRTPDHTWEPMRFENMSAPDVHQPPSPDWKYIYWIDGPAALILAKNFLRSQEFGYEVVWDLSEDGRGMLGNAILTHYASPCFRPKGEPAV